MVIVESNRLKSEGGNSSEMSKSVLFAKSELYGVVKYYNLRFDNITLIFGTKRFQP